jgi:hypothetical protein
MTIKTFRGLIAADGTDTIVLHTNDGSTGYRIVKFQGISNTPGDGNTEAILKIHKIAPTGLPTATVDFSDNTLLGVNYTSQNASSQVTSETIIFDSEVFNQDIYITHYARTGSVAANYYIELEQIKLDLSENTVATLKDIRNITAPA